MKPVFFISDLHLQSSRPDVYKSLIDFIDNIFSPISNTLYILGDLFEYWIGDDGVECLGYTKELALLTNLTKMGKQIFFIHGNRDFLVGDAFSQATGVKIIHDPVKIFLADKVCLLKHGDDLCTNDVEHQEFRMLTRNANWQNSVLSKSLKERLEIASQMRQITGSGYKPLTIMDVNIDCIKQTIMCYKADILVHGHTHRPGKHNYTINGRPSQRIVLGDWDKGISYLKVDEKGFELIHQ